MKILVLSDTHGKTAHLSHLKTFGFDELWYLGDFYKDASLLSRMLGLSVEAVKGNCDLEPDAREEVLIERKGHKILLTHGHLYGVKNSTLSLFYKAKEANCDLVCYGHTHLREATEASGLKLFNPGSPSKPHLGDRPSYGVIEITDREIHMSHGYL